MPLFSHNLECKKHYNIIVAGGGTAGCAAAIQAAQCGMSVLLLEKKCLLGGLATGGLVNFMEPLCDGRGNTVIHGYAEKWTKMLLDISYDTLPEIWRDGNPEHKTGRRYATTYSANTFSLLLTEEMKKSGADFLFDCSVADAIMEGNICKGVVVFSKAGFEYYECDMLIDTTGDCDVLRAAGVPTVSGKNYFIYYGHAVSLENCRRALENNDIGKVYSGLCGGGVNLFGHNRVIILNQSDLRCHLHGNVSGQLKIVYLFLETIYLGCKILSGLRIFGKSRFFGYLKESGKFNFSCFRKLLLTGKDVQSKFLEVSKVRFIHLIENFYILKQSHLMTFHGFADFL